MHRHGRGYQNQPLALSTVSEKSEWMEYSQYSRKTRAGSRGGSSWRQKSGELENKLEQHFGNSSGV